MAAFGFDGAELGRIERILRRDGTFIVNAKGRRLSLPTNLVGLVGDGFAILRGTARELSALGVADAFAPFQGGLVEEPILVG
jgi:hypothetical protein